MEALSTVIITFNEEGNIKRCIDSVKEVSDEIIVVDSYSTDRTAEICQELGVEIIQNKFIDYSQQKNFALEKSKHALTLSLDADEVLSDGLKKSIQEIKLNSQYDGYYVNRLNNYCGKWIHYSGWYPNKKLRIFNKNKFKWNNGLHEELIPIKEVSTTWLKNDLLHYSYKTIEDHLKQMEKFSTIAAKESFEKGKRNIPIIHTILYPVFVFIKNYIFRFGFLDGKAGFIVCKYSAYYRFLKYHKLYKLQNKI